MAQNSRFHSTSVGKPRQELEEAGHITSTVQSIESDECLLASAQLAFFILRQFRIQTQGMVQSAFRLGLPTSVTAIKTTSHHDIPTGQRDLDNASPSHFADESMLCQVDN